MAVPNRTAIQRPAISRIEIYFSAQSRRSWQTMSDTLTDDQRKEVFRTIVETQDQGMSVADSRRHVASEYSLSENEIRDIERAGIEGKWPPL